MHRTRPSVRRLAPAAVVSAAACAVALLVAPGSGAAPVGARPVVAPAAVAPSSLRVVPRKVLGGLVSPVLVTSARDGVNRLYVVELAGRVRIVQNGAVSGTYLDIRGLVTDGGERGLLGLAFSSGFQTSRYLYVTYTRSDGALVLARFRAPSSTATRVDPATRKVLLVVPHPTYSNHNGGNIAFGRDGYLYLGTGDGGGGGDPFDNAQDLTSLSGKILRLDVSKACGSTAYCVPPTNPYAGQSPRRGEIWMSGVRNPWRWSFDTDGTIYVADVGQDRREEVTILGPADQSGRDLEWSYKEGRLVYDASRERAGRLYRSPTIQLCHDSSCRFGESITGGFVYRGSAYPDAVGLYVFGDFVSGRLWGYRGGWTPAALLARVTGFGLDDAREMYAVTIDGGLYRIRFATV
jgi:Glucose / Sorbosone dehydrogenase